eukprot:13536746-Alexandrium_andersonii.AAC.1
MAPCQSEREQRGSRVGGRRSARSHRHAVHSPGPVGLTWSLGCLTAALSTAFAHCRQRGQDKDTRCSSV